MVHRNIYLSVSDYECSCPAGFHLCAGHCLRRLDRGLTFDEAVIMCAGLDAHLAVPRTSAENQCAIDAAGDNKVWLGGTEVPGHEGHYVGADACGDLQPFWAPTQPDNLGSGEDRIVLSPPGYLHGWHDYPGHHDFYPLCQLALSYRPNCK